MELKGNKKLAITLIMLGVILSFFGGTVAYWSWETSESQKTEVAVTVTQDFMCTIDGGGGIESTDYQLIPTGCMDPDYAIQRTVTVSPTVYNTNNNVLMEMWIDVNTLNSGLSNSQNFKYALTTSSTSCTEGVIESGTFNGLSAGGQTANIFSKSYGSTTEETYYLYIWLDSAETSSATQEQSFSLSLNGNCTNDPYPAPNAPELDPGMIPVTIANDGTVTTVSSTSDSWYNYDNKEWANVVLVNSSSRSSYLGTTGKTVSESDILAYYVWIPRYKYRIQDNLKCSTLSNSNEENNLECYVPYVLSDDDKELFINWWHEYEGSWIEEYYGVEYTLETASEDVETMLNIGYVYVEEDEEVSSPFYFYRVIDLYNNENEIDISYSEILYENNILTGPRPIDIVFETADTEKSNGDAVNTYYTHPAFTFGNSEVSGIWVGKFETGHSSLSSSTTSNNLGCTDENCTNADGLIIKPNVQSLRYNNVSNQFYASRSMSRSGNPFGLNLTTTDSHMMKNSEWGAVAYLSHSQYGINTEIRNNNNSNFITGCGASVENGSESTSCEIAYGSGVSSYPQSTTGNIFGIYDMSGGSEEFVMGNYGNIISSSGFTILPDTKYYDLYSSTQFTGYSRTNMSLCTLDSCGGHALYETSGWYSDYEEFVSSGLAEWFRRGGWYYFSDLNGLFYYGGDTGDAAHVNCFRSVLIVNR